MCPDVLASGASQAHPTLQAPQILADLDSGTLLTEKQCCLESRNPIGVLIKPDPSHLGPKVKSGTVPSFVVFRDLPSGVSLLATLLRTQVTNGWRGGLFSRVPRYPRKRELWKNSGVSAGSSGAAKRQPTTIPHHHTQETHQ